MVLLFRWLSYGLSLVGLALAVLLITHNTAILVELNGTPFVTGTFNLAFCLSLAILLGLFIGVLAIFPSTLTVQSQLFKVQHQKEKAQVTAETQSDQVKALEAKVETLEKALEKALAAVSGSSS